MLLLSSANPETLDLFRATYYRPKLLLWLLLFFVFPDQNQKHHLQLKNPNHLPKNTPNLDHVAIKPLSLQQRSTQIPQLHHNSIQQNLPCPDAYLDHRNNLICPHAPKRLKSVRQRFDEVRVHIRNSLNRWSQPAFVSPQSDALLPIANNDPPSSPRTSPPRALLCAPLASPFIHLLLLLHSLLAIQALALLIEDALIKEACASSAGRAFRRATSWRKRWARFRFRLETQWCKRAFVEPFALWIIALLILATIAHETLGEPGSWRDGQVWLDLPFHKLCRPSTLPPLQEPVPQRPSLLRAPALLALLLNRPPFLKPARALVLLESLVTLVCLLQPAQHILPTRIIPLMVRVPDWLLRARRRRRARPPPPAKPPVVVEVETKWLLAVLVEACICLGALASYTIVIVHLPYASHYSIPFFLTIYSLKSIARQLSTLVHASLHTIDCLDFVLCRFSTSPPARSSSSPESSSSVRDQGCEEEWRCSICFEEEESSDSNQSSCSSEDHKKRCTTSTSTNTRSSTGRRSSSNRKRRGETCRLDCSHRYHARCLVKWLHYQTFCPVCHRDVRPENHHPQSRIGERV